MKIIVEDAKNDMPKLDLLPDICVQVGTLINQTVKDSKRRNSDMELMTFRNKINQLSPY